MSALGKEWKLNYERPQDESLWSSLMNVREVTNPGTFFSGAEMSDLHDPFLFPQMQKAVDRVNHAIASKERIVVYGDYDVDGNSGAALLIHTMRFLGAEVSYRIPHRQKDGYGLHQKYIDEVINQRVKVLITVDCGISCPKEVASAQERDLDIIITDHHTVPEDLPNAFAILHPKLTNGAYPFEKLSGSGVAFKLASAMLLDNGHEDRIPAITDLASLGTVADCVPLVGENRTLVKLGLAQMKQTQWDGLRAILESAGSWGAAEFSSQTIGFQVGPRLNASGRMDNPLWSLQTLLASGEEARQKSLKLESLNQDRRHRTLEIMEEAEAILNLQQPLIIEAHSDWASGLVGLIAGRLQDKYSKPTFILEDRGDSLVGSARSLPGFHAVRALDSVADLLVGYGGHEQAAGFHLKKENYEAFKSRLMDYAENHFKENPLTPQIHIDLSLRAEECSLEAFEQICSFAPFGIGNPEPVFLLEDVEVVDARSVGQEDKHLKFTVKLGGELISGIAFGFGPMESSFRKCSRLLVNLDKNEWRDKVSVQLRLVDFG